MEWDYVDPSLSVSDPSKIAGKNGFAVYDDWGYHNYPLYYGLMITDPEVVKQMIREKANGCYSLIGTRRRPVLFKSEADYVAAQKYKHYGRVRFQSASRDLKAPSRMIAEYPEIDPLAEITLDLLNTGITVKQMSAIFKKNETVVISECFEILLNNIG